MQQIQMVNIMHKHPIVTTHNYEMMIKVNPVV